jgi:hypothetical protein
LVATVRGGRSDVAKLRRRILDKIERHAERSGETVGRRRHKRNRVSPGLHLDAESQANSDSIVFLGVVTRSS